MKKNAKRRNDALAKKNQKTTTLRIEPLESREMLSATGWETGVNENVAFVATEDSTKNYTNDLEPVRDYPANCPGINWNEVEAQGILKQSDIQNALDPTGSGKIYTFSVINRRCSFTNTYRHDQTVIRQHDTYSNGVYIGSVFSFDVDIHVTCRDNVVEFEPYSIPDFVNLDYFDVALIGTSYNGPYSSYHDEAVKNVSYFNENIYINGEKVGQGGKGVDCLDKRYSDLFSSYHDPRNTYNTATLAMPSIYCLPISAIKSGSNKIEYRGMNFDPRVLEEYTIWFVIYGYQNSANQPDIAIQSVNEFSCANEKIPEAWGAVVEEPTKLTMTVAAKDGGDINLNNYAINSLVITGKRTKKWDGTDDDKNVLDNKEITILAENIQRNEDSKTWTITCNLGNDWIPKKDDDGEYEFTCAIKYTVNGEQRTTEEAKGVGVVNQPHIAVDSVKLGHYQKDKSGKETETLSPYEYAVVDQNAVFTITCDNKNDVFTWNHDGNKNGDIVVKDVNITLYIEDDEDDQGNIIYQRTPVKLSTKDKNITIKSQILEDKQLVLTVGGWTPKDDQFGKVLMYVDLEYGLRPIEGTTITTKFNDKATKEEVKGEIDVDKYYVYVGRSQVDESLKSIGVTKYIKSGVTGLDRSSFSNFTPVQDELGTFAVITIDREVYYDETLNSNKTFYHLNGDVNSTQTRWIGLLNYLNKEQGYGDLTQAGNDGQLPAFYSYFTDYHFTVVFSRTDLFKKHGILNAKVKSKEIKDTIYVPDASTLGNPDKESNDDNSMQGDAVLERMVRSIPEFKSNTRNVWELGDLVFFSTKTAKSANDDCVNSGTTDIIFTPYVVTYRVDNDWLENKEGGWLKSGFQAVGLTNMSNENASEKTGKASVFMARGTEGSDNDKLATDVDPDGVGSNQYNEEAKNIKKWYDNQDEKRGVVTVGHSLGGALAQLFAKDNVTKANNKLKKVVTFQSAGLSAENAKKFTDNGGGNVYVQHYVANGDIVSISGVAFLEGKDTKVHIYSFGDYSTYADDQEYNRYFQVYKHNTWLLNTTLHSHSLSDYEQSGEFKKLYPDFHVSELLYGLPEDQTPHEIAKISVADYSSYYFHYTVPGVLGQGIGMGGWFTFDSPNLYTRYRAEATRKVGIIGGLAKLVPSAWGIAGQNVWNNVKNKVENTLKWFIRPDEEQKVKDKNIQSSGVQTDESVEGWKLRYGFKLSSKPYSNISSWLGFQSLTRVMVPDTPQGYWRFDGLVGAKVTTPSGLTLPAIMTFAKENFLIGAVDAEADKNLRFGGGSLFLVKGSSLSFDTYSVNKLNSRRVGDDKIPDYAYKFIKPDDKSAKLSFGDPAFAEFKIKSLTDKKSEVEFDVDSIDLFNSTFAPEAVGNLKYYSGDDKIEGWVDLDFTLSDEESGESEVVSLKNAKMTLSGSKAKDSSKTAVIEGVALEGKFAGARVRLTIASEYSAKVEITPILGLEKVFNFNMATKRFVGSFPNEPETPESAAVVDSTVIGAISSITVTAEETKISVAVVPSSNAPEDALYAFYLSNARGESGALLGLFSIDEATPNGDGSYSFEFELDPNLAESGEYFVYAHEFYTESFEDAVFATNAVSVEIPEAPGLAVSASEISFGNVEVGDLEYRTIEVSNPSDAPTTFYVDVPESSISGYYVYAVNSEGDILESDDYGEFEIAAGETIQLYVFFAPIIEGESVETIAITSDDGETVHEIALSAVATPMPETTISTSTEGATVSDEEIGVYDDFTVVCEVVNVGDHIADVATVSFYATTDPNDPASGVLIGTAQTGGWLELGERGTVELETSFPETTPGEYYIGWVVEWSNQDENAPTVSAVLPDAITVEPPTVAPQTPRITIVEPTAQITVQDATAGVVVASVFSWNFTPASYRVNVDGTQSADFAVENGKLVLTKDLAVGSYANIAVVTNCDGELVESEPFMLTVGQPGQGSAPNAPSNLVFGEYDSATRRLPMSWTDNSDNETKFVVQYSLDGANWKLGGETAADVSQRVATGVAADRTYYFRVAAYNDYGYSDWLEASIHTTSEQTPKITVVDPTTQITKADATAGAVVATVAASNFTPASYRVNVDGTLSADFAVKNGKLVLTKALAVGSYVNITVVADANGTLVESEPFTLTVTEPGGENNAVWNLDEFSAYKSFKLDATQNGAASATLYGLEKDGKTYKALKTWDNLGTDATATITGRNVVAENLWITESAAALLGEVKFNGGDLLLDQLTLDGTAGDDSVKIGTETVTVETTIFTTNPYEKALENYRRIYGETSPVYQRIAANLDAAYQRLSKQVTRKTSTWGVVELNGMTTKFLGTRDVAINTGAGDDRIQVDALHYNYTISTKGGANSLDFANAKDRVNLDLGATYRQCALIGDGGTLQLAGTFTRVVGTPLNDRVVGTDAGLTFVGNGGSDSVKLVGGQNDVLLNGPRQSVIARGVGRYNVVIEDGDYSVVNAGGVTKRGSVFVSIEGRNASVFGGLGTLEGAVEGDYATVSAGATQSVDFGVVGDHAVVTTGVGADTVSVVGDYATVTTDAGDDVVYAFGAYESVNLGAGDDECVLADGTSGNVGYNHVWGDAGNDAILAGKTSGINYFYAGIGNDVVIGGAGEDYIYANAGDNVLIGLDGVDRLFGGSGRDVLVASATDALANVDLADVAALEALYAQAYQNWDVDKDLDKTVQLLGEHCLKDGAKDWVYRGGGRRNLIYASDLDADFENALERSPFEDELKLDQR